MPEQIVHGKKIPARKLKKQPSMPTISVPTDEKPHIGDPHARSHLEKGILELQSLHKLLLSSEVDPDVLADFEMP